MVNAAEERAKRLLLDHLTPAQQETFKKHGYFEFKGSKGHKFRLYTLASLHRHGLIYSEWRLVEMETNRKVFEKAYSGRNIYTLGQGNGLWDAVMLPESDTILAIKILIEADERYVAKGCQVPHDRALIDKD